MKIAYAFVFMALIAGCSKDSDSGAGDDTVAIVGGHKVIDSDFSGAPADFQARWQTESCTVRTGGFTLNCTADFQVDQANVIMIDGTVVVQGQSQYFAIAPMEISGNLLKDTMDGKSIWGRIGQAALSAEPPEQGKIMAKLIEPNRMAFSYTDPNGSIVEGVAHR